MSKKYLHTKILYKNADGTFLFVTKKEALQYYLKNEFVMIGCQTKDGGCGYSVKQFEDELPADATKEEKFKHAIRRIKESLPHTRIKFQVVCKV